MATNKKRTSSRKSRQQRKQQWELSQRSKIAIIATACGVILCVGGYWLFDMLVAPPKPDPQVASAEQVVEFLGHPRGLARMPIERREEYLVHIIQVNDTPEKVEKFSRALRKMSSAEKQQMLDATFEIGKEHLMEASEQYSRTPESRRAAFVDSVIANISAWRNTIGGPNFSNPNNLANPFKDYVPSKSDQWAKAIIERTTPRERAKAKPLIDDISTRLEEMRRQGQV